MNHILQKMGERILYGFGFGLGMGLSFKILKKQLPINHDSRKNDFLKYNKPNGCCCRTTIDNTQFVDE